MYHSHFDEMTQGALGVMGLFVIPRHPPVAILNTAHVIRESPEESGARRLGISPNAAGPPPYLAAVFTVVATSCFGDAMKLGFAASMSVDIPW